MKTTRVISLALAVGAGLMIGWLDISASSVQGTLLLLLVSAFAIALVSQAAVWQVALAVAAGLPLAHLLSRAMGQPGKPQFAMLLVALPLLVAASAGRGIASVITSTSASLGGDDDDGVLHLSASQLLGAALIGCALAGLVPVYATLLVRGQPHAWWVATIWQVLTLIAWAVATPFLFRFWRRVRAVNASGVSAEELVMHAGILLCIGAQHAIVIILVTRLLFIPLGPMPTVQSTAWAFAAYLPIDALTYCLIVSLSHAYDAGRQLRAATAREAAVRGELATTRLSSLQAQLRPHFLFNALNAATVLARRGDAERSGDVLARLSDLLRYVLRGAGAPETPGYVRLDEELAFAGAYLAIERERFADRLHPVIDADDDARNALVPHLVLQPLVENAIHHGVDARIAAGHVRVAAQRDDDRLILTVDDDGPGPGDVEPKGIGLANTTSRLATLYGDKASVNLSQRKEGGTRATIVIPYVA